MKLPLVLITLAALTATVVRPSAADEEGVLRPDRLAIVFNMGYAGDNLPKDAVSFEKLVQAIKQARFNVILGKYEDWRAEICAKHGIQIMPDPSLLRRNSRRTVDSPSRQAAVTPIGTRALPPQKNYGLRRSQNSRTIVKIWGREASK